MAPQSVEYAQDKTLTDQFPALKTLVSALIIKPGFSGLKISGYPGSWFWGNVGWKPYCD